MFRCQYKYLIDLEMKNILSYVLTFPLFLLAVHSSFGQSPPPSPVVVAKVVQKEIRKPLTLVGTVEPSRRSLVASEVEGLVERMEVKEGNYVRKGQVLAQFKKTQLFIALREAGAAHKEAKARHNQAVKNFKRFNELHDKGVASVQQLHDAETEKDVWSARIDQTTAKIDKLKYEIEQSSIVAPFSGFVTRKHTEIGQWVESGDPIVELIDISNVEISVDVPERYVNQIKLNTKAGIIFDAMPGMSFEGAVISIVPQADEAARNFIVKFGLPNKDNLLISGMVARVSLMLGEETVVTMVPKDAIVDANGSKMAFVVNDGVANPVPVSVGFAYEDMVQVSGKLNPGQNVVIRGNERLKPGQPVSIVNDIEKPDKS